jgi:hypothetical protein
MPLTGMPNIRGFEKSHYNNTVHGTSHGNRIFKKDPNSLSLKTKEQNRLVTMQFENINGLLYLNDREKQTGAQNTSELLAQTTKECKTLIARLNRIVTSQDKLHVQVFEKNNNQTYDIIEGLDLLLKVNLKDKQPPLVVTFHYQNKDDDAKLVEAFYSTEFKEPKPGVGERLTKVSLAKF